MNKHKRIRFALLLTLVLFVVGLGLQAFLGHFHLALLASPTNLIVALLIFMVSFVATKYFPYKAPVQFLSSGAAAISALLFIGILSLILGLTFQTTEEAYHDVAFQLGLRQMTSYYPFVLAYLYLLLSLSFITFKRLSFELSIKNIGFFLNHAGLLIVLISLGLGAADKLDLRANVLEGQSVNHAIAKDGEHVELPFTLKLVDFRMESYMPKLGLIDNASSRFIPDGNPQFWDVDTLKPQFSIASIDFKLEKYIAKALPMGASYVPIDDKLYMPAVKISAASGAEGWVTCGNSESVVRVLRVDDNYSLVMLKPEAKEFSSDVVITTDHELSANIAVNQPTRIGSWFIYQSSYDNKAGEASKLSGFQFVYNPWRNIIQVGFFMMLFGALALFWGVKSKNN